MFQTAVSFESAIKTAEFPSKLRGRSRCGGAGIMQEARVLHGGGPHHHVAHAHVQVALDGVQRADATAQLHGHLGPHGIDDGSDHAGILRLAGKGAIQVHQVEKNLIHVLKIAQVYRQEGKIREKEIKSR